MADQKAVDKFVRESKQAADRAKDERMLEAAKKAPLSDLTSIRKRLAAY